MALPALEAMAAKPERTEIPQRMVAVGLAYGFVPDKFFPTQVGRDYAAPPLLELLADYHDKFTVFSGLDHGSEGIGGHQGTHAFLSGILAQHAKNFEHGNVSVDQVAADWVGAKTRYPSLQLSPLTQENWKMSWNKAGVGLAPLESLTQLFNLLFTQDSPAAIAQSRQRFDHRLSVLDVVAEDAKRLQARLGATDRERLDLYFTSIRSLENSLVQSEEWLEVPKPTTEYALSDTADTLTYSKRLPLFYDLMALALATDQTRVITLELSELGANLGGFGISSLYHTLSHHGKVESVLEELHIVESFQMASFGRFLGQLQSFSQPDGSTLLDNTMCLIGSGLGNASSHSNKNLPLLLAGGGFKHGQHLAYGEAGAKVPATNLYLSMLQRFGVEIDSYNLSTGTLTGLDFA